MSDAASDGVAIVGMAGRFPGAASVDELWANLLAGRESITRFTPEQLSPLVPRELREHPRYVPARGVVADADRFDAGFFGISAREAQLIDPQQRVFLELCWNALEHAGIDPARARGGVGAASIGVFAGTSNNGYRKLVEARPDLVAAAGEFAAMLANEKDYVATRVAHKLGLTGPAISLYTACSTSLVAIAQAWYALMSWQCDVALAGGVNIAVPQESGYLPAEGAIESADGHCRPFDADATGTVFSSGAGVVVLKRLADAIEHGDTIWAVIRGVGVNNDGADKASFSAPSVRGQAAAIRLALASAGVEADSIGYVEAHGTGTPLGDPIEIEALARAFAAERGSGAAPTCWIGSLKGNLGHLVAASGVAGLIKATLALHHGRIPASLNYRTPNPEIDFARTPFKVVQRAKAWTRKAAPRRAGVSSFGVGGTNAHVVLEEAPQRAPSSAGRPVALLPLSARDPDALRRRAAELADALAAHTDADLADIGATLALGRKTMAVRGVVVARTVAEARTRLARLAACRAAKPKLVFLFPGQGSQHANMARELVAAEPAFRESFERCCELASRHLDLDLRALILPMTGDEKRANAQLAETRCTQPALFAVEYALARWWQSIGLDADAMIGHSIGEYVAATLAGVFTLEDAIALVCARGAAMQAQPPGAMLAVRAAEHDVAARLPLGVTLAAVNAPELVVVAGAEDALDAFAKELDAERIASTRLKVSHAFHSASMDGALPAFERAFAQVRLAPPTRPFHSCVSGRPIRADEATDPAYWLRQLREPVRFADAVADALADGPALFVEVGPSQALTTFVRTQLREGDAAAASLGAASRSGSDAEHLAQALGECWRQGREPDWDAYFAGEKRHRVVLPGYPFGGERYWIETSAPAASGVIGAVEMSPPAAPVPPTAPPRGARLRAELRELVENLSGEPVGAAQDGASLLELGLDSLSLTQAALELERRYGLKLKFRRLMEDLDSIDKLADLLDATLPADAPAPVAMPAAAAPVAADAPLLTQLIQSQMALMQQQTQLLAALAGGAAAAPAPAPARVVSPAVQTAVAVEETANLVERPFGASARITLKGDLALSPSQRAYVDDFTRAYNARTAQSKAFSQQHRARMADPRVVTGFNPLWKELVYPLVVERSKGARLWDVDGNEYVDCLNAFGANFLGYQPDYVADALKQQIDQGFEVGPQHPLTAEVAELIAGMTGMQRVAFCNTGSEAVMGAMRVARTVTGRKTIAIFTNSYHGIFDEVIVRGTRSLRSIAAAPGILASAVENVLVLDYGSEESLRILRERAHELAAILIEPVQGKNPSLQPREFVRALRPICDEGGCALIFDEVITGFRIAPGGAQEFYGVRADLATYGKIIGGGLPFAAIAGSAHWMDALDGGDWRFGDDSHPEAGVTYFAGTFVRHPLALAAAKAALTHLQRSGPELQRRLNARTAMLIERLNAIFAAHAAPLHAVGFSSLWRIVADEGQPFASLFWYALRANGLHVYEQFNCFLTEAHTDDDVERIVAAVEAATAALMRERLLSPRDGASAAVGASAVADAFPLTQGQLEKWLGGQYGGSAALAYNEAVVLRYDGALDVAALKRALEWVWSRHEAFRLAIAPDGRTQSLRTLPPLPLRDRDFSAEADVEARLDAFCREAMHEPFDLDAPPLLRLNLIRLGKDRHALHVLMHHLAMDGWSLAVFCEELETAYNAYAAGGEPELPPAQSYRAYVLDERARRASNAAQLDYWRARHLDPPPPLALPSDRPRAAVATDFSADSERHAFTPELADALRQAARRRGATLYGLLLAGFAAWLARASGRRDFVVAIPFAGQALAGSGALIGDGVNTLPLRLAVAEGASTDALVADAQRALLDAAEHQDLTLLDVVHALGPRRRDAQGALAEVVFNLNPRVRAPAYDDLAVTWQDCRHAALLWDLFFNLNDDGHALSLDVHYRTALFDAATIRRWIGEFERTLAAFVPPDGAARAPLPPDADSAAPVEPAAPTLPSLIEAQVQRAPDRVAIEGEGGSLSYAQLWRDSAAFAANLRAAGVARGDLVGVCMPRRIELLPALLGVLRAGAAYVPLDPAFPDARLRTMIEQSALRHVVVFDGAELPAAVQGGDFARVAYSAKGAAATGLPRIDGDDLAYVLFTSGSTGVPKGVRVLQRNLANFLVSMRERPGLDADDVLAAVTTLSFDIAGLELYLPLIVGARIRLLGEAQTHDPLELARALREAHASVLQTTPTLLRLLVDGAGEEAVRGLKLLVGGEALPRDLAERVLAPARELWNLYGPTETTIWSSVARVERGGGAVPLGQPIANTTLHLLDAEMKPVASGAEGELWIGGAGVADGYLGRPDLTAERFRADPFAADGSRMYRTGDIGSLRDGVLHFHGRADDQIKLRGHRIEPGDIEAAARAESGVREAAAVLRRFGGNDERLVLYVGAPTVAGDLAARLRERLREALPPYMRPQQIEVLATLPHTPNGKIDRKTLAELAVSTQPEAAPEADAPTEASGDAREAYLGRLWSDLIGLAEVRPDDNFFELGGHSLLAVEMATRVQRDTGVRLNLMAVATGTLGSLASQLPEQAATAAPSLLGRLFGRGGRGRTGS
ncbi:non-ribosomal peptide synthetase/type I polyketide synthase [Dokdonella sp.]|uniref:non-ribosomal peptide synthetase/type I polyketide synthase n=1 Tax=Dokdonella sp. TaxID=2291710 RepID=UPI001B0EE9B1|nr:non-ribosomal peptide synthetase/type I polyketide synthase [Dokdonella sp.]MBO9661972.1 amino acid adenylation domain-containing protein [Dokdonella sp.]